MGFLSWFKKDGKNSDVEVNSTGNALENAAVAAAFAEAGEHEHARSVLKQEAVPQKIMVLSTEDNFSNMLINYALDMAKRLDCELVAVNVTDVPRSLPGDERQRAIELFEQAAKKNSESLIRKAESEGVKLTHMVETGDAEKVADRLHSSLPGIRCVVTEPEEAVEGYNEELIPVYCFA